MESGMIKTVVLAYLFACFALASCARNGETPAFLGEYLCKRNNVVKREGLQAARSRQIRVEIDLITPASCRKSSFYFGLESKSRRPKRPSERAKDET